MTNNDIMSISYDQYSALFNTISVIQAQRMVLDFELERVAMDKENYLNHLSTDLTYGLAKEMDKYIEMTSRPGEHGVFGNYTRFEKEVYVIKDYDAFTKALKDLLLNVIKVTSEKTSDELPKVTLSILHEKK